MQSTTNAMLSAAENGALAVPWYYRIEVEHGVITPGKNYRGPIAVRKLLRGVELKGQRCLDIGTMEGMYPVLLCRRGAAEVVAYDRMSQPGKVAFIQQRLGVEFKYVHGMELPDFQCRHEPFDVVVCGGLLYHAFDPLVAMLRVRSMVRNGGILIFETAAIAEESVTLHFNAAGSIYNAPSSYWFPTVRCLEYLLRYARLLPLDCAFVYEGLACGARPSLRFAVACRAMDHPAGAASDTWMHDQSDFDTLHNQAGCVDWQRCKSNLLPVEYTPQSKGLAWCLDPCSVDLGGSLYTLAALEATDEAMVLRLSDAH
jgi:2-polyprenyl-3-methyl-5-hydroxy-6-metoxy-1,4-benzoquinol methylase